MDMSEQKHLTTDYAPAELDEASRVLLRAADLIERRGWCQNTLYTPDGALCIMGAFNAIATNNKWQFTADNPVWKAYERLYASLNNEEPAVWNDEKHRTKFQVVAKLRALALGAIA